MLRWLLVASAPIGSSPARADPIDRAHITIVDGDTIRVEGEPKAVRLVGFDAPETSDQEARCDAEKERGQRAKVRLTEILDSGGLLEIRYRKHRDRYGRLLGRLTVDGQNVGKILIRESLAVRYNGRGPKMDWCPIIRRARPIVP